MDKKLLALFEKYLPYGKLVAGELALPSETVISFAKEMTNLGILMLGADGWYKSEFANLNGEILLVQDLEVSFYVGDETVESENNVELSFYLIEDFIKSKVPPHISHISITLDLPIDRASLEELSNKGKN